MYDMNEILDFAIQREKEAIVFYQNLQQYARFAPHKQVLKDFEKMEEGHVILLEGIKKRHSLKALSSGVPDDIKLASYLHEVEPGPGISYQDILIAAMKKEERAVALYTMLRDKAENGDAVEIFSRLVKEEESHRHHFETLYDQDIQGDN
jgi:rubrerythrin